jgi:hypothetical protein
MKSRRSDYSDIEYREVREDTKDTSNTATQNSADIVDKDYEKCTREDNEMKKNNSDSNSLIENLDQTSKSRNDLIKSAKQKYSIKIKKFTFDYRKQSLKLNFDSDDVVSIKDIKQTNRDKFRIVTDALIEMQTMKSNNFIKQFEFEQIQLQKRFDTETT